MYVHTIHTRINQKSGTVQSNPLNAKLVDNLVIYWLLEPSYEKRLMLIQETINPSSETPWSWIEHKLFPTNPE
jgi:hypothetical protein